MLIRRRSKSDKQSHQIEDTKPDEEFLLRRRDESHYSLLRLCETSDWENAEKCSAILTKERTAESRRGLLVTDTWGNTPLHIACYHKPPPSVVGALLEAAASTKVQFHTMVNKSGATPLAVSCKAGACKEVIRALLNPHKGLPPGGSTVATYDIEGNTPFSGLINRYEMIRKIPTYKEKYKPLEQIKQLGDHKSYEVEAAGYYNDSLFPECSDLERAPQHELFPLFGSIVDDLIQTVCTQTRLPFVERNASISLLHGAAYLAGYLPPKLVDLILRVHVDDRQQHPFPSERIPPIHLALCGVAAE